MGLKNPDFASAISEFSQFLEAQKGAYSDACAGYRTNHRDIARQVSRVLKTAGRKLGSDGIPSIVHTSVEDPTAPDVIVSSTRLSSEFLEANSRSGSNEQQMSRAIVIFVYSYWEDVTRYKCAKSLGCHKNEVRLPVLGDLRLIRHTILHDQGILSQQNHKRLEVLNEFFRPSVEVIITHDKMHNIFRLIDKGIAKLTLEVLEVPPPPGGWKDLTKVAIPRQQR